MLKILVVCPDKKDATSFYRASGVLPNVDKMMNRNLSIGYFQGNNFTWAELLPLDIIYFQRPAHPIHLEMAKYCKNLNKKIWVDYDDNLFTVPNESRAFFDYDHAVQKNMLQFLMTADAVSVSTENLKEFFVGMGILENKIYVIPNALNDDIISPSQQFNQDSKVIVWRGSETHCGDMTYFSDPLFTAITESKDTEWHFLGYNPFILTNTQECVDKIFLHKGEDVIVYNKNLRALKPKIMHVPLADNQLNKAKSNIAWIEATYSGAVTIAPNWPEWNKPGIITYDSPEDYKNLLINQSADFAKCWKDSMNYIKENLMLSKVNLQRKEIIETLIKIKIMETNLGKQGRDKISGFTGIISAYCQYFTGCNQYALKSQRLKDDGSTLDDLWIDCHRVEIIGEGIKLVEVRDEKNPGGPQQHPFGKQG